MPLNAFQRVSRCRIAVRKTDKNCPEITSRFLFHDFPNVKFLIIFFTSLYMESASYRRATTEYITVISMDTRLCRIYGGRYMCEVQLLRRPPDISVPLVGKAGISARAEYLSVLV